ncbi:NfeD family protein [Roseibium salinum]|uniref:NfeD family protein n=1 Tax=Roseibium salinum TaxID=1604349 RepID=A0ABT3R7N9_9HYPH|nr:NfeD family protein [Roseibium sp. DSM 29163]MCX2725310.1 NfeD family protein [Roseibium sp. DSM 29163]
MIESTIRALGPWSWFVLGLFLLGLEILAPGTIFLWFGLSALAVGLIALVFDFSWQVDVSLFVLLSVVSLLIGRRLMRQLVSEKGDPGLNQRGSRYVGREFTLTTPLREGAGNLSVDDTIWRITGPDLPAGTKVRVEAVEGARLVVAPASAKQTLHAR